MGNPLNGLDALERFKHDAGFEFGFVSSTFGFPFVGFSVGSTPAAHHTDHGSTTGPIFAIDLNENHFQRIRSDILTNPANLPGGSFVVSDGEPAEDEDAG